MEIQYTVELLYCGHLARGLGEVSCTERCPHFRGKLIFKRSYLGHKKVSLIQRCLYWGGGGGGVLLRGVPL